MTSSLTYLPLSTGGALRVEKIVPDKGQRVVVLHQGPQKAGVYRVHFDGRDDRERPLASGVCTCTGW